MLEEELPDSDSSDEDFRPGGEEEASDLSEEESDDPEAADAPVQQTAKRKSAPPSKSKRKKKRKTGGEECLKVEEVIEEEEVKEEISLEDKKKKADSLWADFLKDCGPGVEKRATPMKAAAAQPNTSSTATQSNSTSNVSQSKLSSEGTKIADIFGDKTDSGQETAKEVEVYEFAGEKVVVEKKVDAKRVAGTRGGGVSAILSQLTKKNKLSTLEKSKLDWNSFKEKEGISEQLSAYNKGKNGYLEKQDFLERADLRKFEIEKQMRAHTRSKRL